MAENLFLWDIIASNNDDADPAVSWPEGMLPGAVNNSARATMAGIARFRDDLNGSITTTGTSTAYLATANSAHTTYTNGIVLTVNIHTTNTAAAGATLNLNSFGAKPIRIFDLSGEGNVRPFQLLQGRRHHFIYDTSLNSSGGGWLCIDPTPLPLLGSISLWSTDSAPNSTLFCNGAAVSRSTYAGLFGVISTLYGIGDGSTTFNLPDFRDRVPVGQGDMGGVSAANRITAAETSFTTTALGNTGGVQSTALTVAQLPTFTPAGSVSVTILTVNGTISSFTPASSINAFTPTGTVSITGATVGGTGTSSAQAAGGVSFPSPTGTIGASFTGNAVTLSGSSVTPTFQFTGGTTSNSFTGTSVGSGSTHTNVQPGIVVNYIIQAL